MSDYKYDINKFGYFKLNETTLLNDNYFDLKTELILVDLISQFLPSPFVSDEYINNFEFDYDIADKIKNLFTQITKSDSSTNTDDFIIKIFGNLADKSNIKKQSRIFTSDIKMNIYGFDNIDQKTDNPVGYENNCALIEHILSKKIKAESYIFYYVDKNYKIMMMVNKSILPNLYNCASDTNINSNNSSIISEHIYIHKSVSTILYERLYGKNYIDMPKKLHMFAIQQIKPKYLVSTPLPVMVPIFEKLCDDNILKKVNSFTEFNIQCYDSEHINNIFCAQPSHIFVVL